MIYHVHLLKRFGTGSARTIERRIHTARADTRRCRVSIPKDPGQARRHATSRPTASGGNRGGSSLPRAPRPDAVRRRRRPRRRRWRRPIPRWRAGNRHNRKTELPSVRPISRIVEHARQRASPRFLVGSKLKRDQGPIRPSSNGPGGGATGFGSGLGRGGFGFVSRGGAFNGRCSTENEAERAGVFFLVALNRTASVCT